MKFCTFLDMVKNKISHIQDDSVSSPNSFGTKLKFQQSLNRVPQEKLFYMLKKCF